MKIILGPSWSQLSGTETELGEVKKELTIKDKEAAANLKRFQKGCFMREKAGELFKGYTEWKEKKLAELKSKLIITCYKYNDGGFYIPTGLAGRFIGKADIKDERNWDFNQRSWGRKISGLRPWQQRMFDLFTSRLEPYTNQNYITGIGMSRCATGTGKTRAIESIIQSVGCRSIFLVPSDLILKQTVERFGQTFGKNEVGSFSGSKKKHGYVTVATYQSVNRANPEDFAEYTAAWHDEVHHLPADTFYSSLEVIKNAVIRVGFSADESRNDGCEMLIEAGVGPVVFDYPAAQAIKDGILATPMFVTYEVNHTQGKYIEWKEKNGKRVPVGFKEASPYSGDKHLVACKNWMVGNDWWIDRVADLAIGMCEPDGSKCVLCLVDEKEMGEKLMEALDRKGAPRHEFVVGGQNNEAVFKEFNKRKIPIFVGTSVLSEGADTVPVDVLINCMGGRSPKQAVGRGLRVEYDDEGNIRKNVAMIIDFKFAQNPMLDRHYWDRHDIYKEYECGEPVILEMN